VAGAALMKIKSDIALPDVVSEAQWKAAVRG
jgi:hypothetical protein